MLNQNLLLTGDDGYNLTNSLRFRSSASAYLNRTGSTPTNGQKMTLSFWVKRGALSNGTAQWFFTGGPQPGATLFGFFTDETFYFAATDNVGQGPKTSAVFRDCSAWYHIVLVADTTLATATDRQKIYVNGVLQAVTYPAGQIAQNATINFNSANVLNIGRYGSGVNSNYLDGYLTEVNFIDGQALTPSSFGSFNALTGVWQPARYTGTYGTNGFYLPFTDNSALTTSSNVGLGRDYSGNGNYWTTNNISITAGTTYDSMTDVPTLTSTTAANYATFNPLISVSGWNFVTLSNGNLTTIGNSATNNGISFSTQAVKTGKWYAEFTCAGVNGTYPIVGISDITQLGTNGGTPGYTSNSVGYSANGSKILTNGTQSAYGNSYTTNDVIGVAVDADNGAVYFSKNGVFQNSGVPTSGASKTGAAYTYTGGTIEFYLSASAYQSSSGFNANFGQQPFAYTPPTGFVALNTFNLPSSTIVAGNKQFNAVTRNGYGSSGGTLDVGFQPDFVWEKMRNGTSFHTLWDSVRGLPKSLYTNDTSAEVNSTWLTNFTSNGLTFGTNDYGTSSTFVEWCWKANGTAVTNTAGSITSQVSANPTAGFSVVTYTGNATNNATVGHGLGVAPAMIIIKDRVNAYNWTVYHKNLTSAEYVLLLNSTSGQLSSPQQFNSTAPTSSVFTLGWAGSDNNTNATTSHVAYCFAAVAGYSAFGSYTGNGSSDGTFVYLGFRPRFIMTKVTTVAGSEWEIYDTSRTTYNVASSTLEAQSSAAEVNFYSIDILSNGFKQRNAFNTSNQSGQTFIYMAFAENPFKNSLAR